MHKRTTRLFAVVLAAAGLLFTSASLAQDRSPSGLSPVAPGPAMAPDKIPDDKIDATAAAVKKVSAIAETYDQKVARAPAGEKDRLVDEADKAMTTAITDQGLSLEEYTTIIRVAQNDPVVRGKLLQRLE